MMRSQRMGGRVLIIDETEQVSRDRRVWLECLALTEAGYRVSVICPMFDGDPPVEHIEGIAFYRYLPPPPATSAMAFIYEYAYSWVRTLLLTFKVLRHEGFDVLQACNPPDTYFAIAWLYKLFGKPFVYDHHDLAPETYESRFDQPSRALSWGLRVLERLTYRTADGVIATNDSYREVALTRGGKSAQDVVVVVRSGPDPEEMRPGPPRPELRNGRRHLCCYLGHHGSAGRRRPGRTSGARAGL
jgi:glycosyltransferase involved in cell wall biosynthesis